MPERILVALGGHALVKPGQRGTIEEQAANLRAPLEAVAALIGRGHSVVMTHGNGPQVGHILIRSEQARGAAYELPLDVCVAQSQGEIGYLIQQGLENLVRERGITDRPVATILTRTLVDRNDPRMRRPTKPVGPSYAKEEAGALRARGWTLVEEAQRGYRRVVPSPKPIRILETAAIQRLVGSGAVVIAAGGGGVPVARAEDGTLAGVEAVVDKDYASGLLAAAIGVQRMLDLTAVPYVKLDFGSTRERDLIRLSVEEAKRYLAEGHFAPGSMGPKIEAAVQFLKQGGREVIIALPDQALQAFEGKAGTHIVP